jgi:aminoglycoside/choline kinase family phosphotransferase
MSTPASETDLTAAWFIEVMPETFPELTASDKLEIQRIGQDYGFASEIFRCRFGGDAHTQSVIVKLWPIDATAAVNEALFYETFGSGAGTRVPVCFHAGFDAENKRGVVILEDLTTATQGDCLRRLTREQADVMARSLAGLHGKWLNHPELDAVEWLPSTCPWQPAPTWLASRRLLFLERFGDQLDDFSRSLLDQLEHAPQIVNDRLAAAPITLLHGDFHLDNILFENNGTPVILDWSRCARGPLVFDLANLLFDMCEPDHIEATMATYIKALRNHSAPELDAAQLSKQLGAAVLRLFTVQTCGIAVWKPRTEREQSIITASIQRAVQAVHYWREREPAFLGAQEHGPR